MTRIREEEEVAYTANNSRTQMPSMPKFGVKVPQMRLANQFRGQTVKDRGYRRAGAYRVGRTRRPHCSFLFTVAILLFYKFISCKALSCPFAFFNPIDSKGNYSATSNSTKLVHWPLVGGLLHLVQQGGAWAGCGPAQSPPRCTKSNSPPTNGQCTNHCNMIVRCSTVLV